ncbi:IclR family transcriptional regulator [Actinoplanes sp. OR16]|uniref:IclR family transcriptional regulator n=1 Tax=Actinoplanes sp. OR16 TaxID=946334 RepID=UPI00135F18CD|nr:IclR family transcriptional regulator [Actinoplanes sp. OR16]
MPVPDPSPSVLSKALLLLGAFGDRSTLGLSDLSRRSGIAKATVHRLAQELVDLNMLERVEAGYQLGWRMYELGQLVPGPANLRHIARPALMDLHSSTRATVHLAVQHDLETVFLERLAGLRDTRIHTTVGTRVPIWFAASGKVFIAHSTDEERLVAALEDQGSTPRTGHSIRSARQLKAQMTAVRERRWSTESEETLEGYKSYAVPITLGDPQHVVAAVSATLPLDRHDDQQVVRMLWATAAHISRALDAPAGGKPAKPDGPRAPGDQTFTP